MTTPMSTPKPSFSRSSAASTRSCSTYYSSAEEPEVSVLPYSSWSHLKCDLDRSLKTFDTKFDISCLDEVEDELVKCPLDSFAALCYQAAVARTSYHDPGLTLLVDTPDCIDWEEDDGYSSDSSDSLKFASSFSEQSVSDSLTMPTIPFRRFKSSREISIDVSFPYILYDARMTTVVSKPHESVHHFPVGAKKQPRQNTLTKMLSRIKFIPKCISSSSSPSSPSTSSSAPIFSHHLLSLSSSSLSLS